eukprot:SM000147S01113  [mRNA]  locus=s147:89604:92343:+ [translate_table: standard]
MAETTVLVQCDELVLVTSVQRGGRWSLSSFRLWCSQGLQADLHLTVASVTIPDADNVVASPDAQHCAADALALLELVAYKSQHLHIVPHLQDVSAVYNLKGRVDQLLPEAANESFAEARYPLPPAVVCSILSMQKMLQAIQVLQYRIASDRPRMRSLTSSLSHSSPFPQAHLPEGLNAVLEEVKVGLWWQAGRSDKMAVAAPEALHLHHWQGWRRSNVIKYAMQSATEP